MLADPLVKACMQCSRILPADSFLKEARRKSGLSSACAECTREYHRAYRSRPHAKEKERVRAHRPDRKAAVLEHQRKPHTKRLAFEKRIWREFGITVEDWARAYERQGGRCAGCRLQLEFNRRTHVDHCHKTGAFRGLACHGCNLALGYALDNPETLVRLAAYLKREN